MKINKVCRKILLLLVMMIIMTGTNTVYGEETQSEENTAKVTIISTQDIKLQYDDHINLDELIGTGYAVVSIENESITSYKVSKGVVTDTKDTSIIRLKTNSLNEFDAAAIGKGKVIVVAADKADTAKKIINGNYSGEPVNIEAVQINIEVEPARLTMMFIAGQSNAQGSCSINTGYNPQDSVVNKEGTVYSTYAPHTAATGRNVTAINDIKACNITNVDKFVAGDLTSGKSQHGGELVYGIDSLTYAGNGKTGLDGALAYEWNLLSQDKVWVVNAGAPGTGSNLWIPGTECYERAVAVFNAATQTEQAEITAGHYVEGNRLLFWLQGEQDARTKVTNETYMSNFLAMYNGMTQACQIQHTGIIAVRASVGSFTNEEELKLTCSRYSQYALANSHSYPGLSVVSRVNEKWISDESVSIYFWNKYPGGYLTYPLRSNATIGTIPTTMAQVHNEIHYSQAGHNENGIDAAFNMYYILNPQKIGIDAGTNTNISVSWREYNGSYVGMLISHVGRPLIFSSEVNELYNSGNVVFSYNPQYVAYDATTGCYTAIAAGDTSIDAKDINGNVLSSLYLHIGEAENPNLTVGQEINQTTISWETTSEASIYRLYKRIDNGKWKVIGDFTDTCYIDKSLGYGHTYDYQIKAYYPRANAWSAGTSSKPIKTLSKTVLRSAKNDTNGIRLTWDAVENASGYYIYRQNYGAKTWSKVATIRKASRISWVDKKAVNGRIYSYKVVAFNSLGEWPNRNVRNIGCVSTPEVTRLKINPKNQVQASWRKNMRANGYEIKVTTATGTRTIKVNNRNKNNAIVYALGKNKYARITIRSVYRTKTGTYYSAWSKIKTVKK